MKKSKLSLVAILVLFLVTSLTSFSFASKADELMKEAQVAVAKAEQAKTEATRDRNYKEAIDDYNTVVKSYPNSVQAVQAEYNTARIYETAKGSYYNLRGAYDQYDKLIYQYDRPVSELSKTFERGEIPTVQSVVASSKRDKDAASAKLNAEDSKKPLYKIMDFFVNITGARPWFSYWFAIVLVTIIVKLLLTPLTKAQFKAMKEMQKVAPLIKEIQEKHKGDQKTIGEKTMQLYKEHHINPFASCLPLLVQMPILWLLYSMIRLYEFQFAKGKFLWIGAVHHPVAVTVPMSGGHTWITAMNLAQPDLILVVLYLISMYISTRLSAVDPSQAEQQKMMAVVMPIMFAFIFAGFPSAFLLYWLVFNILQTLQQWLILRPGPEAVTSAGTTTLLPAQQESPSQQPDASGEDSRRVRRRRRR